MSVWKKSTIRSTSFIGFSLASTPGDSTTCPSRMCTICAGRELEGLTSSLQALQTSGREEGRPLVRWRPTCCSPNKKKEVKPKRELGPRMEAAPASSAPADTSAGPRLGDYDRREKVQYVPTVQQPGGDLDVATDPNQRPPPSQEMGLPCAKCGTLYPLPRGASSWRCRSCGHFNAMQSDGGFIICTVM